jgi:hypothetical protein
LTKISGEPTLEVFFLEGTQLLENFWNPVDGVDFFAKPITVSDWWFET